MKLSEALRLGSVLPDFEWRNPAKCACGKALEVVGVDIVDRSHHNGFLKHWPWLENIKEIDCPICGVAIHKIGESAISWAISHLAQPTTKTKHSWTMNQIADWIETIEPKEASHPTIGVKKDVEEVKV